MTKPQTRTLKAKQCKVGGEQFIPVRQFQPTCFEHASEYLRLQRKKKEKKEGVIRRKKIKVMKEKIMSYSNWQARLQPEVNHIARLIDYGISCVSCDKYTGKMNGGHYHSQGGNPMIRFNLHNIFKQTFHCNHHKSANIKGFNKGLVRMYGKEYHEYVEFGLVREYKSVKPSIPELQEAIKTAREIVKSMKEENKVRTPQERIRMRRVLNRLIGIYPK